MPDKYEKLIVTLQSIRDQTYPLDAVYLGLPKVSRRLGLSYPPLDPEIEELATIVEVPDYGSITKLAGALYREDDPEVIIITFDDDMVYPNSTVEELVKRHQKHKNSAIGSSGMLLTHECPLCAITPNQNFFPYSVPKFRVGRKGRKVDSIFGYPGALYIRKFFPPLSRLDEDFFQYALTTIDTYTNDDIIISGYLSKFGIERRIFNDLPEVGFVLNNKGVRERMDTEISLDLDRFFQRMNRAIVTAKELGMFQQLETVSFNETIFGLTTVAVLAILLVISLAFLYLIL